MIKAAFYTLGCKLNQLETESLADAFRREGFEIIPWDGEAAGGVQSEGASEISAEVSTETSEEILLIVNTCTVTSHAEQKARHVIRKALRGRAGGVALITGCYAQMEEAALTALAPEKESRVFVVPGERKDGILELPVFLKRSRDESAAGSCSGSRAEKSLRDLVAEWAAAKKGGTQGSFRFAPSDFSFHSRAFLKIQDGCDKRCAYCRVSIARGKSRSGEAKEILAALTALETRGYREAVLTGVNISQYSGENGRLSLAGLLEYLLSGTEKIRLRLSSLEPEAFTPDFFRAVSAERIRPHFHISLQSGSPRILERMGRAASLGSAEEGIRRVREIRDDPFIACDIIAGFPGETPEDFEETFRFCEKTGFAWIHVFPFSRRPGTAAWNFKDRVSEREARARAGRLAELARRGRQDYTRRWIGRESEFVPDSAPEKSGCPGGITANYLKVFLPAGERPPPEGILRCGIVRETGEGAGRQSEKQFDAEVRILP